MTTTSRSLFQQRLAVDGNGRMGRLWQTLILLKEYPVFEFLPLETLIRKKQKEYYAALAYPSV